MKIKSLYQLARNEAMHRLTHFWDTIGWSVFIAVILLVFVQVWGVLYQGQELIEGYTLAQMIWYLTLTEVIVHASGNTRIRDIGEEIRSGNVVHTLTKPLSFIQKELGEAMGEYVFKFIVVLPIASAITYILVGGIPLSALSILLTLVSLVLSFIISFQMTMMLGLLAFWFEDVSGFYFIYTKMIFILGGMLVPLEVYPQWLYNLIAYLPFGAITYVPSRLFVLDDMGFITYAFSLQVGWALVLGVMLWLVQKRAVRRIQLNGG